MLYGAVLGPGVDADDVDIGGGDKNGNSITVTESQMTDRPR